MLCTHLKMVTIEKGTAAVRTIPTRQSRAAMLKVCLSLNDWGFGAWTFERDWLGERQKRGWVRFCLSFEETYVVFGGKIENTKKHWDNFWSLHDMAQTSAYVCIFHSIECVLEGSQTSKIQVCPRDIEATDLLDRNGTLRVFRVENIENYDDPEKILEDLSRISARSGSACLDLPSLSFDLMYCLMSSVCPTSSSKATSMLFWISIF
jgi:hypothetical protein